VAGAYATPRLATSISSARRGSEHGVDIRGARRSTPGGAVASKSRSLVVIRIRATRENTVPTSATYDLLPPVGDVCGEPVISRRPTGRVPVTAASRSGLVEDFLVKTRSRSRTLSWPKVRTKPHVNAARMSEPENPRPTKVPQERSTRSADRNVSYPSWKVASARPGRRAGLRRRCDSQFHAASRDLLERRRARSPKRSFWRCCVCRQYASRRPRLSYAAAASI
jgi:hypothetical protein